MCTFTVHDHNRSLLLLKSHMYCDYAPQQEERSSLKAAKSSLLQLHYFKRKVQALRQMINQGRMHSCLILSQAIAAGTSTTELAEQLFQLPELTPEYLSLEPVAILIRNLIRPDGHLSICFRPNLEIISGRILVEG